MLKDIKTAAQELGCSPSHVRRMIKRGAWPSYRIGPGAMRLDPVEIRALTRTGGANPGEKKTGQPRGASND